jgi:NIPSNAP
MRILVITMLAGLGCAVSARAQAPPSTAKDAHVYELRTYYAAPGKLEALHSRFRNHTIDLFKRHGMGIVAFWVPVDATTGAATGNTLVYILSYQSLEARKQAWDAFGKDPEWISVKTESEKDGKLVDKVDSVFLAPTDYSPMK